MNGGVRKFLERIWKVFPEELTENRKVFDLKFLNFRNNNP